VDIRLQIRNQRLTCCGGAQAQSEQTEGPDQESKAYTLWTGQRRQAQDEWTEGPRSGFHDLHPVEGPEKASSGCMDRRLHIRIQ